MKNLILSLLIAIALTTALPAQAECPSDNAIFCSYYQVAEQGNANAQYLLGWMYFSGAGVAVDDREAVRWYRKAAEQGNASAQYNLGWKYYNGEGVAEDLREAVRWYRKSAEQGDADAQFNLGLLYYNGEGVAEDKREAVRWYRKAAEQGHADAQNNLGVMYSNGKGVAEDKREAVRWYRKAAEQGIASAQYNLGQMYRNGKGVAEDDREAVRWYRKSAEQGNADAQVTLGVMYVLGEGVIEDQREAYIWWSIAKANGHEKATDGLDLMNQAKLLTTSEIKSARHEATRRLANIDRLIEQRKADTTKTTLDSNIALAKPPKGVNVAERVFEKTWRSVVVVKNHKGQGSGVIIRPNVVATNCHVIDGGDSITVYKASNRRADTDFPLTAVIRHIGERDFCVLDVDGLSGVPATVRKYHTLKVGEDVYGLGAPSGLDLSLSAGIVSQLREINGYRVIQTDAAISPGSSGGGLFDRNGNLIGITTFKFVDKSVEGIGFAIPADLVLEY